MDSSGVFISEGAFISSRLIFENRIWKNVLKFRLFFYLYGNAVYDEKGKSYGNVHVKRGQILKSLRKLQEELEYIENNAVKKYSISSIKRSLDELRGEERIAFEATELGTLITILNYEQYQDLSNYKKDTAWNTGGTPAEHRRNNNKKEIKEKKDILITPYKEILENYHLLCPSLPTVKVLTDKRKGHLNARWDEYRNMDIFEELFRRAEQSDFLSGRKPNNKNWRCDFDWLINQQNMTKVLEGKYDNKNTDPEPPKKMVIR